jgi:hypothetical protein
MFGCFVFSLGTFERTHRESHPRIGGERTSARPSRLPHKNNKPRCLFHLDLFREPDTPREVCEPRVRPKSIHHGIELYPSW